MRIAIVLSAWRKAMSLAHAAGIRQVRAFYLAREFRALGIEVVLRAVQQDDLEADHCLCLSRNVLQSQAAMGRLRKSISGKIGSICDTWKQRSLEDITFYCLLDEEASVPPPCIYCGVAADGRVFQPWQSAGAIRVLLDHPHYGQPVMDDSQQILESLRGIDADVFRFGRSSVEWIKPGEPSDTSQYAAAVLHRDVAAAHNLAHVFVTTHPESLGLSVIEAAMAGDLIVTRRGHLKPAVLEGLRCYVWDRQIDWEEGRRQVDPGASRRAAEQHDRWPAMAEIMVDALTR